MSHPTTSTGQANVVGALVCILAVGGIGGRVSRADVFKLAGGGEVQGVWVDRDVEPASQYKIQLPGGGRVVLAAAVVLDVHEAPPLERQYQLFVTTQPDDVDGHWAVAQWCDKNGLKARRREHLERVIRLDDDHGPARHALGYSFVKGEWVTQEEYMQERGFVRYRNRWHFPQEVKLLEERRQREAAQLQWYRQISCWRREMGGDESGRYVKQIAEIRDPHAIVALVRHIREEPVRSVRMLYVRTLAAIDTAVARNALLNIALSDYDEELMHVCFDHLVPAGSNVIHERALKSLHNEDNLKVNRAALLLKRLKWKEDIIPLVNALCTLHEVPMYNQKAEKWEKRTAKFRNREVLAALVAVSGASGYGYDQQAWKQWHFVYIREKHRAQGAQRPVGRDAAMLQR